MASSPANEQLLQQAMATLHHRGPESEGLWISESGRVGLGHVRLSLIDLSVAGNQPLFNATKSTTLVANGELYGFQEQRAALVAAGHRFSGHSDSEVLLHLYDEHGLNCFEHMRGEFAFSLFDSKHNIFVAGRDRFGIKPLFYAVHEGRLVVGSEVKALFAMGIPARWNTEVATKGGMSFSSDSLFRGVNQVPPGHYLTATPGGSIRLVQYWDNTQFPAEDQQAGGDVRSEAELVQLTRDKLVESVNLRMHADVPVSVYLSGGLDSCAIMGIAAAHTSRPVDAFTVCFTDDDQFDEQNIAQRMADHTNASMTKLEVRAHDIADHYEDMIYHTEVPSFNGNGVAKYLLSRVVRDSGRKVVLTGEGSDEVFCGYQWFKEDYLEQLPRERRDELFAEFKKKNFLGVPMVSETERADEFRKLLGVFPGFFKRWSEDHDLSRLFKGEVAADIGSFDPLYSFVATLSADARHRMLHDWHPVHSSMFLWSKTFLVNNLLTTLGDRCEMAHSVEGRVPFLDHKLVELVNSFPLHTKLTPELHEKYILREAVKPFITREVYERQKHPFLSPPATMSRSNPLYQLMQDTLRSDHMKNVEMFDHNKILNILDRMHSDLPSDVGRQMKLDVKLHQLLGFCFLQKHFNPTI